MDYEVTVADVPARRAAVIAAATTWQEFPTLWGQLLGEVWGCLRAGGIERGCRSVILYGDSAPTVEVGVLLDQPCSLTGCVVASTLPAGTTATAVHRGSFAELGGGARRPRELVCRPRSPADRNSLGGVRPTQRRPRSTVDRDLLAPLPGHELIHQFKASRAQRHVRT